MDEQRESDKAVVPPARTSLGEVAFVAYGNTPGPHGPWKTFDGAPMPPWDDAAVSPLTRQRWEAAARAVRNTVMASMVPA